MTEPAAFLYPMLEAEERDVETLLADLARSAEGKWAEGARLREEVLDASAAQLERAGAEMAARFDAGGRLFTLGNGGSAADAAALADVFARPLEGRPLPARSLATEPAVLTALANDIGFDAVFSRQLMAHAAAGDIVVGLSTSGGSRNVLAAMSHAARIGSLTVAFAGYDGGQMASSPDVAHCLVARSDSVHRIQETQVALMYGLWRAVQRQLKTRTEEDGR